MSRVANASTIRLINRGAIVDLVRKQGPISRSEIARTMETSLTTVKRIVDELVREDLIRELGATEPSGGRPRSLLAFNGNAYSVVGIDLGGNRMYGALADLSGVIQYEESVRIADDGGDHLGQLCDLVQIILNAQCPGVQRIRGIGVGVPGVTRSPEGKVVWAPRLGWRDLPLQELLVSKFNLPVFVENDVKLAALGEWGFGAGRGAHNLVCISVGTGIGAGVIIGDKLYRGRNQAAGEIGYFVPSAEFLGRTYGEYGALERLASGSGMAERARELLRRIGATTEAQELTSEDVFLAARRGEAWARQVVRETVDYLSVAVSNVNSVLDPDVIVLGGGIAESADLLLDPILERIRGVTTYLPRLAVSPLGRRAAAMGAIVLVMNETSEYVVIEERS